MLEVIRVKGSVSNGQLGVGCPEEAGIPQGVVGNCSHDISRAWASVSGGGFGCRWSISG